MDLLSSAWRAERIRLGDLALDQAVKAFDEIQKQLRQGEMPVQDYQHANNIVGHLLSIAHAHYAAANVRSRWMPADE